MTTAAPHGEESYDSLVFLWNLWWVRSAVFTTGTNPLACALIGMSAPANLFFHTLCPLNGLLSAPVQWLVPGPQGLFLAHNLLLLFSFAATGLSVFALALHCTRSIRGSVVAGALVAFSSYRLVHLEHDNLLAIYWVALTMLFLLRLLHRGRLSDGIACGLCAGAVLWTSFTYAFFLALLGPVWILAAAIQHRRRGIGRGWLAATLAAAVFAAACLPFVRPALEALELEWRPTPLAECSEKAANAAALAAPFSPQSFAGRLLGAPPVAYRGADVNDTRLGLLLTVLAGLGLFSAPWKRTRLWALTGACFLVFALGPRLHVLQYTCTWLPLPYEWLWRALPLFRISREPVRFLEITRLCMGVLAAFGVRHLLRSPRRGRGIAAGLVLLGILIAESCTAPIHLVSCPVPQVYNAIARTPGPVAVLDLPMGDDVLLKHYLYWQTGHGQRLVRGLPARRINTHTALWRRLGALHHPLGPKDKRLLAKLGIRFVVWHHSSPHANAPLADDEQVY